jgi:TolA-binding protein
LLERVTNLEDQMRRLQGRIDELDNARQRQYDDLAKQIGDLNFKLQAGGAGAARAPGAATTPPQTTLGAAQPPTAAAPPAAGPPPRRTPEMTLQEGNAALARRDYPAAEAAAREALSNPRNPRAADAQFLLAEALAAQRNWPQAAVAYDDTYKRSPQGAHAQDALLGVAVSLNALGGKKESCEALEQFKASFPSPRPDLREQVAAARQRAGCR